MTTLSPSKADLPPGRGRVLVDIDQHSPQGVAHVPRSVLSELSLDDSPHTVSLTAAQALQAFSTDSTRDNTLSLSTKGLADASRSDMGTRTSSESSIEIITERSTVTYGDVKSASPRKPLPAQWMSPPTTPTLATAQRASAGGALQGSLTSLENKTARATRSSLDIGKPDTGGNTFLTKEALDAVDTNIASPTIRRKLQSPTKAPWNSPNASPKAGNSPSKSLSPRTVQLGSHVIANHRRGPSSVVSTGASSFYTAHGSPVRSLACSQISSSSDDDSHDETYFTCVDDLADIDAEQTDNSRNDSSANTSKAATGTRAKASRSDRSIGKLPKDTARGAEKDSVDLSSPSSPTRPSASQSSRIPRMSSSKGSSVRAPTLSSTLKQTKSTQALRSPTITRKKSMRQVRTTDSAGSTPILLDRQNRDFTLASVDSVETNATQRRVRTSDVDRRSPQSEDTETDVFGPGNRLPVTSGHSRATSSSTVKATQTDSSSSMAGLVNTSDADDEDDDSVSARGPETVPYSTLPTRRRSAQHIPNAPRATKSQASLRSSPSDLRATASEFVPGQKQAHVAPKEPALTLPDLYALDGYGIPWFYHMYPVPWMLPPMSPRGKSRSPKRLRPRKQRSTMPDAQQAASDLQPSTDDASPLKTPNNAELSDAPFASQLSEIAFQTARQPRTGTVRPPREDLTSICNVVGSGIALPVRRRNHYRSDNGVYGGRGGVGLPLHATVPFPSPVAPMGRPAEAYTAAVAPSMGRPAEVFVANVVGAEACGEMRVQRAEEYYGGLGCHGCEADG